MSGWWNRGKGNTLEEDSPVSSRLDAVADRLERVTEQLEQKLAEMRSERDQEGRN